MGYFGQNCSLKCNCLHEQHCNPIDGTCDCIGFKGKNCEEPCPQGTHGKSVSFQTIFALDSLLFIWKFLVFQKMQLLSQRLLRSSRWFLFMSSRL